MKEDIKKGMLVEVTLVFNDNETAAKFGDLCVVMNARNYEGALSCEVYNQRLQKRYWTKKQYLKVVKK